LRALETANRLGLASLAFLGRDGGPAASLARHALIVAHSDTARIQEAHQFLLHCLMDQMEKELA
jgi:D-sedoheptulose 7-phosphate isomerase